MAIHYMDAPDLRSVLMQMKCVFMIPNLMRKPLMELPSGSYKNRGTNGRFKKSVK